MRNKKNLFKTMLVLAMAMIMTLAMGITALAEGAPKIIITPTDEAPHTYKAYAIFTGDVDDQKVLTNAQWGNGVDSAALIAALTANDSALKADFDGITFASSATDVVAKIAAISSSAAKVTQFADIVAGCIDKSNAIAGTKNDTKYEIEVANGYYFVQDEQEAFVDDNEEPVPGSYTKYILQVVGDDVPVTAKSEVPTIDKVINEDGGVKYNTAGIGDSVKYKISTAIPDMTGYNKYYFIINDTLDKGLTLDESTITVKKNDIATDKWTKDIKTDDSGNTAIKIVLTDVITNYAKNDAIEITYSAVVNKNAVRTNEGNKNTVNLTFSNNPNHTYTGTNEPDETDPVGVTPDSVVKTYTTEFKLLKIDGVTGDALAGAEFEIESTTWKQVYVTKTEFTEAADGTYYKLKNGTYTTQAPASAEDANYDSTEKTYKATVNSFVENVPQSNKITAVVDGKGELLLSDVNAGTYTITETKAPQGYNKIDSFTVTVKTTAISESGVTWDVSDATMENGVYVVKVENSKGIVLPTTGGIGTTIFYVIGGILVLGAAVLLITKKRMSVEE